MLTTFRSYCNMAVTYNENLSFVTSHETSWFRVKMKFMGFYISYTLTHKEDVVQAVAKLKLGCEM